MHKQNQNPLIIEKYAVLNKRTVLIRWMITNLYSVSMRIMQPGLHTTQHVKNKTNKKKE